MRPFVAIVQIPETFKALQSFSGDKLKMFLIHVHIDSIKFTLITVINTLLYCVWDK